MAGGRLPDLVEKQRAAVRRLEEPLLALVGVGERALHVAEELALQQVLGKGPAVDGDEGRVLARRQGVDGLGHELLARPALSRDEHGGAGGSDRAHDVEEAGHGPRHPEDPLEAVARPELGLEAEVLLLKAHVLERLADDDLELVHVEGLGEIVVGPELHGPHRRFRGAVGGHHDHRRLRRGRLDVAQDLDAVAVGQADVGDDHVHRSPRQRPSPRWPGCRR